MRICRPVLRCVTVCAWVGFLVVPTFFLSAMIIDAKECLSNP